MISPATRPTADPRSGLRFAPETEYEYWTVTTRADWGITDGIDMALILAYADITSTLVSDTDGSPMNVQRPAGVQTIDYYTAELRFSGRAWDRVDWTVGGFYYDGESINDQIVSIPFLSLVFDGVALTDPSQPFVNTRQRAREQQRVGFATRRVRRDGQVGDQRRNPLFERREGGQLRQHAGAEPERGGRGQQH